MLMTISDPDSPTYGQQLSFEQLRALVHDPEALKAIHSFLDKHGVPESARSTAPNGEFVEVKSDVETLEKMFGAEVHVYRSESREKHIKRSLHYSMPHELAHHVTHVSGLNDFPMYHRRGLVHSYETSMKRAGPRPGGMTPALIVKTYRLPNETDPTPKSDLGVFEALGQSYSEDDLAGFQKQYGIPRQKIDKIIGPNDAASCKSDPNNCVEAALDVEYVNAMAQGAPMTYWSIADENGDIFLEWIKAVAKTPQPAQVFSISYGGPEHLQDQPAMGQFSAEVCKMGLRGLTIFVATGDDGVAGYEARGNPSGCGFKPDYPAGVPFVTSVGATMGPALNPPRDEMVCMSNKGSIITSGGGFSTRFPMPDWQTQAVATYLATAPNMPPLNQFNSKGRAYPDVSSLGNAYNVLVGGNWYQVSGTSASSPVFCGMVALINGAREVEGKSPLGFLNPVLYKVDKSCYNDVSDGVNNCAARTQGGPTCCKYGFSASKGWDAATGWGSLDFPLFAAALEKLP